MNDTIENKTANSGLPLIRDPAFAKNRVFIGNLPFCTREELESICKVYGNVLASLVQKNFGFVQFESEEIANKVASALTKSSFKGNIINVRNAGSKQPFTKPPISNTSNAINMARKNDYNDCEIIVVDRKNTKYAELIEERLKRLNIRVDVLFPNSDVPLGKVLSSISSRRCLYAILVTNQHEEHNSITVNILYGQPAEHRNMPIDDAINLINEDFRNKLARGLVPESTNEIIPNAVSIAPVTNTMLPSINDRHPETMRILLEMLCHNKILTVSQYDTLIGYLVKRREIQIHAESGSAAHIIPDPEIQLQKKILTILNKPSIGETQYNLLYSNLDSVKEDGRIMGLLGDLRVQKALDSLMDSNLLGTVQKYMKF